MIASMKMGSLGLMILLGAFVACGASGEQLSCDDVYGCAWNADGLVPLNIGRLKDYTICIRFRAQHTGSFTAARFYFIFRKLGYYQGDGGEVLIEVQPDDGSDLHGPSGEVLASVQVRDPMAGKPLRKVTFDRPVITEAGKLYHFVFTNPAPDPLNNWVSLDQLYQKKNTPDMQPAVSDLDLAIVLKWNDPPWSVRHAHTPIYWIYYDDGSVFGQGYFDARSQSGVRPLSGEHKVREIFTVSGGERIVKSVRVRVRKLADSGPLKISLLGEDGTSIAQGDIAPDIFETGEMMWVEHVFAEPLRLADGETYSLVLSSPTGSYNTFGIVQSTGAEFITPTVFSDGIMQYTENGKWTSDRPGSMDMQAYFVL
jgi:hypothetical protein